MASSDVEKHGDRKTVGSEPDARAALELLAQRDQQIAHLLHRIEQLEKMLYGPRSAKRTEPIDPSTLLPFPGIKDLLAQVAERAAQREREEAEKPAPQEPAPKPRGRRRLDESNIPPHIPRRRRDRKLAPEQCACGCGGRLHEVREEISSRIERVKVTYVDERVTTYYACRKCERVISTAPDQPNIVEGGILGPSLIADIIYQRFGNHTPYHRLAREFEQDGLPISRSVLCRTTLRCGEILLPIYEELKRQVLSSFLVQLDDTPVTVRNGRQKGQKTGRVWVYRSAEGDVVFDFRMDRSQEGPRRVLGEYRGFVQGDDYGGHHFLFRDNIDRISLLCWAHAVRKFRDADKSSPRLRKEFDVLFALLNKVELEARGLSPPERLLYRSRHARPILKEIEDWVEARRLTVLPKSPIGDAIEYLRTNWEALTNYLLDGRITDITNNAAERALRRVAVGRKNWVYVGIEEAGQPAAVLMSLLQTCVEHGVNAIEYLRDVLTRIGEPGSAKEIADLTPAAWKRSKAAQERAKLDRSAVAAAVQSLVFARS